MNISFYFIIIILNAFYFIRLLVFYASEKIPLIADPLATGWAGYSLGLGYLTLFNISHLILLNPQNI